MATVGVAVPIPDPFGTQLREARASFGDPMAATVPSHITLVPPTPVPDDEVDCFAGRLEEAASRIAAYPLQLRGTGTFRPVSPVVFVAVSLGISSTEMLAGAVRSALGSTIPEAAFPFHPHVTVAQDLDDPALDRAYEELADFECRFTVESFALYLHEDPTGWAPQRTFALNATTTGHA